MKFLDHHATSTGPRLKHRAQSGQAKPVNQAADQSEVHTADHIRVLPGQLVERAVGQADATVDVVDRLEPMMSECDLGATRLVAY